jgi:hypothetical protein
VERDLGLPAEGAASLHTTRRTIVMRVAQSQPGGGHFALAQLCRTALLREEVGRTVSGPADIDEEIHALCKALIASEGRLGP